MEPQSHPRAGTPVTTNGNKDNSANEKKEESQVILSRMEEENEKKEPQQVTEHPGGRHETENKNVNSNHDNNTRGQESIKAKARNDTEMANTDKEAGKTNQKTSKSCILI